MREDMDVIAEETRRELSTEVAGDVMTVDPMVVDASATLSDALDILNTLEIRHLPVVEGTKMVGIISDRDLSGWWQLDDREREQRLGRPVRTLMNTDVATVDPETSLGQVVDLLLERRVGAVPVVDERSDELVGIISFVDVLKMIRPVLPD